LRLPQFSDIRLIDVGKVVSPTRRPLFAPRKRAIVRLEGLGKLKKYTSSGARTGDLPACSRVLQPTTLPRAPALQISIFCLPINQRKLFIFDSVLTPYGSHTGSRNKIQVKCGSLDISQRLHAIKSFRAIGCVNRELVSNVSETVPVSIITG
jgi:hypothetical protein